MNRKNFPFINRELSWLDFNERVLELSNEKRMPLMERLKFISIFSNNLDEFFMIRVAGVIDQVDLGYDKKDISYLTPKNVLSAIKGKVDVLIKKQKKYFYKLKRELEKQSIFISDNFNECAEEFCDLVFEKSILPSISPITLSASNPFPFIYNKRSAFIVDMEKAGKEFTSIVIVPDKLKKLYTRESDKEVYVFTLEHIIANKLKDLFKDYEIKDYYIIRVTRNADLTIEEEGSEDLLGLIEYELGKRRKGQIVRLEINKRPSKKIESLLINNLNIKKKYIYETSDFIDLTAFFELETNNKKLYFKPFNAYFPSNIRFDSSIFDYIKKNEMLLYRPYNDFSLISKLLEIAGSDKDTLSVKITIYRANRDSTIINNLVKIAQNGKSVSVVIELKARFDEEMNVEWARILEDVGCIVTYGVPGLKVHTKNLIITRNENGRIVEYSHLSTGNYNEETAKIYTDLDYITDRNDIGFDNANIFNYLMGYTDYARWKKIILAPVYLRNELINLIDNEIEFAKKSGNGHIIIKVNSLIDEILIKKLYEASIAGVKVDLIVRDMCSLKTDIKGISENIRVISIVGRFLEHPRIFYFHSGGKKRIFISSADFRERNMDKRVESMIEIDILALKERLFKLLKLHFNDNVNAWELKKDEYERVKRVGRRVVDSQSYYIFHKFCD